MQLSGRHRRILASLNPIDLQRRAIEAGGLGAFARHAWPVVIPSPMQWNWHHDLMCNRLEALWRGEITKLAIWVPPGSTKTLLTSVFGPAWVWGFVDPTRISCNTTYGAKLALKSARRMRRLVMSEWYEEIVRGRVTVPFQNSHASAFFENNCGGARFSGSVGGEITGNHFNDIGGDDLNKSKDARQVTGERFEESWEFWDEDLSTRQADPSSTTWLEIGQRLHADDVGGRWVNGDVDVEVLCLPMRFDPSHPYRHPQDPRTVEGELLWPARFDEEKVAEIERRLGPSGAAAQLQQRPIPPGGQLLTEDYLSTRYDRLPSRLQQTIEQGRSSPGQVWRIYGDLTFKGKVTSDFVVFQLWCRAEGGLYLVDQIRGQWGFSETKRRLREMVTRYPWISAVKLEDAANAPAIVDDLKGEIPMLSLAPVAGGCLARTQQSEGAWAAGSVHLPASAPWMGGSDGFVAEHLSYDGLGTRHDDQVATSSLAILDLTGSAAVVWADTYRRLAG